MAIKITQELLNEVQKMQQDKQDFIDVIKDSGEFPSYQAASEVYWYMKLTELHQEIQELRDELKNN